MPTTTTPPPTVPFTIDAVLPGMLAFPSSPDIYRIRLQREHAGASGPTIKYLAAPNTARTLTGPDAHHRRLTNLAFDHVPAGDWVVGWLSASEEGDGEGEGTAKLELRSTDGPDALLDLGLASAGSVWCGITIDIDETGCAEAEASAARWTTVVNAAGEKEVRVPRPTDLQCMDYVSGSVIPTPHGVGTASGYSGREVVCVVDWIPGHWAGIGNETRAHRIISQRDPGLAPRFLAHVTENGSRVVEFLLEHVPDAREAGPADLDGCRAVLGRLHALGIAKRQLRRHSFLVRGEGSVLVRGPFDWSPGGVSEEVLRADMESLERVLVQSPSAFEDQVARMLRLAGPLRLNLLGEFQKAHGVVVPFVYWQEERAGRIILTLEDHGNLAKEYDTNGFCWTKELQEQAEKRFGPSAQGL